MKLFFAGIFTETNTFAPFPSGKSCWRDAENTLFSTNALQEQATERGWEILMGPLYGAHPSGVTPREVYESMRDELLQALRDAGPVHAVQLFLHGAMVADGYMDCEGDILHRVRAIVGPNVPVGAELDLHAHLTITMIEQATLLVGFKEYPHIDIQHQMLKLFTLLSDAAENKTRPVMSVFDCRMIELYPTTTEPMRSFVERLRTVEQQPGVLNAWLCHGFPYGDTEDTGTKVLVTADSDQALAESLAESLGQAFYALRGQANRKVDTLANCIEQAATGPGPVTVADTGDNPGGGAPCDSTFALQELMRQELDNCALGPLWDPVAVGICHDAGIGARLQLRIGGKCGPMSGPPLDVTAKVTSLVDNAIQSLGDTINAPLGRCAAIRIHPSAYADETRHGIDVVLSEERTQAFTPDLFTDMGIDPSSRQILVVKSTQHFYAGFAPISTRILYAGNKGALQGKVDTIPYRHLDTARMWPFCTDPLGLGPPEDA
jgi:microcystin degradation protein MlrC